MFTGTELHLWEVLPYFDPRLPPRQDQPNLDFSVQRKEIASNAEWQQVGHESCKPGQFMHRHCLLSVTAMVGEHYFGEAYAWQLHFWLCRLWKGEPASYYHKQNISQHKYMQ